MPFVPKSTHKTIQFFENPNDSNSNLRAQQHESDERSSRSFTLYNLANNLEQNNFIQIFKFSNANT